MANLETCCNQRAVEGVEWEEGVRFKFSASDS